jgi:hypothetical protein
MIFMRSLSIVVMSQIKLIPTPSWLVYFVLKAQPLPFRIFYALLLSLKIIGGQFVNTTKKDVINVSSQQFLPTLVMFLNGVATKNVKINIYRRLR